MGPRRSEAPRALALLVGVALLVGACGQSSDSRPGLAQVAAGERTLVLTGAGGADAVGDDAVDPADAGPTNLPAGAPCDEDADCLAGLCLPTTDGDRCPSTCADGVCADGLVCVPFARESGLEVRVCVDPFVALCQPCRADAECDVARGALGTPRCVALGHAGRYCGAACGPDLPACPEGSACGGDGQCRPADGVCDRCTPRAVALGAETSCSSPDHPAECVGARACAADGLTACDLPPYGPEVCNGLDDDCDGVVDDLPHDACDGYACAGAAGCLDRCETDADCTPGLVCDLDDFDDDGDRAECVADGSDGTLCAEDADCDSLYCANGYCCAGPDAVCCATAADCGALDETPICTVRTVDGCAGVQTVGACEGAVCVTEVIATPRGCVDTQCRAGTCAGDLFRAPHRCTPDGTCEAPVADALCDDLDPCTFDSCSPTEGCVTAPRTGPGEGACYTHDPATRGEGACHDGVAECVDGAVDGCVGERGPVAEVCNGVDDDCDGETDEGTVAQCAPYVCAGADGCATTCLDDAGCAAGRYCDDGVCVSAGETGSPCDDDAQCLGGRCNNGFCCASGTCCGGEADDCALFDATHCSQAAPSGCVGTRTDGVCAATSQCASATTLDPAGCLGAPCAGATCAGTVSQPAAACDALGGCVPAGPPVDCAPYRCVGGACATSCETSQDCAPGGSCDASGQCFGATLDGEACTSAAQCASGHCDNGFCCGSGTCCGADVDCAGLDEAPVCVVPGACGGSQVVGRCKEDSRCGVVTVAAPAACAGSLCGGATCKNLAGLGLVLEGIARDRCDADGACVEVVEDCRDFASGSYCTDNSTFYSWCAGCAPKRTTCVVFASDCYCD